MEDVMKVNIPYTPFPDDRSAGGVYISIKLN